VASTYAIQLKSQGLGELGEVVEADVVDLSALDPAQKPLRVHCPGPSFSVPGNCGAGNLLPWEDENRIARGADNLVWSRGFWSPSLPGLLLLNGSMKSIPQIDRSQLDEIARRALAEDLGDAGDITSNGIVRIDQPGRARIFAKSSGVLAGAPAVEAVFHAIDKKVQIDWKLADGDRLEPDSEIALVAGRARALLAGERVALNFLQHLSGVATLTSQFVDACSPHGVRVLCTRKTIPGLRALQRYAVVVGGGHLHRAGLFDQILIKNNHKKLAGGVVEAFKRAKANPNADAEVEVETLEELEDAMAAGADRILLDNADLATIKEAVKMTRGRAFLEISGGITLKTVPSIARLKPDAISAGVLTHSAGTVDISMHILGPPGAAPA